MRLCALSRTDNVFESISKESLTKGVTIEKRHKDKTKKNKHNLEPMVNRRRDGRHKGKEENRGKKQS